MPTSADAPERKRKAIRLALSVGVAIVLLALLLHDVNWRESWNVLRRLSPLTWLAVLGVHLCIYVLRTLRFAALIPDRRVPLAQLWSIQAANQFAALLLPLRTGEITYPIYLRGAGVPLEVGTAGLVVSRALDLLAVLTLTVASAIYVGTPIEKMPPGTGLPAVLAVTLAAAALIAVATGGASFIRFLAIVAARFGASYRLLGRVEQVARGFETVGRYRAIAEAFTLTLLIWIGVDLFYYLLMADLGFGAFGPGGVAFGASAAILTNLLPVNTFAGLGTHEWGWTAGFTLLGLDKSAAATTALAVHAVQLLNTTLLGLIAQFRLSPPPRAESERVVDALARQRARFQETVRGIPAAAAERRPAANRWSIAEIVEHLARVEESLVAKMRELLAKPGDVTAGRRVRIPLAAVAWRPPFFRMEAPPRVRPEENATLPAALARLDAARRELISCLCAEDDVVLRGKRFPHKWLGALDLLEWGRFVRYHEERHRRQIAEVARALRMRSTPVASSTAAPRR